MFLMAEVVMQLNELRPELVRDSDRVWEWFKASALPSLLYLNDTAVAMAPPRVKRQPAIMADLDVAFQETTGPKMPPKKKKKKRKVIKKVVMIS